MRVSHGVTAVFDDPNLVSCAGLVPVLELEGDDQLQTPGRTRLRSLLRELDSDCNRVGFGRRRRLRHAT